MRILVSTDGSEFSRAAAEKCCEMLAVSKDSAVKVVSVFEIALPVDVYPTPAEFSEEMESAAQKQAEEFAEETAAIIKENFPNIEVETQVSVGEPDQILIDTAKDWNADLIVLGSHGRGFWGRLLLGSITDVLVHHAPCSVLVVRKITAENSEKE